MWRQSTHVPCLLVQFLFNLCNENAICVGTWHRAYVYGVSACVPRYGALVPFLVPVEDVWQEQENWGFQSVVDIVYDDGVYLTFIIFSLPFNPNLYSNLDHS